jgi:hypothetical protein
MARASLSLSNQKIQFFPFSSHFQNLVAKPVGQASNVSLRRWIIRPNFQGFSGFHPIQL